LRRWNRNFDGMDLFLGSSLPNPDLYRVLSANPRPETQIGPHISLVSASIESATECLRRMREIAGTHIRHAYSARSNFGENLLGKRTI
jgi:hypothetical protein